MVFVSDSSGRFATSYISACIVNENIKNDANIKNNYNYRLYLQRNAKKLIESDRKQLPNIVTNCDNCIGCKFYSKKK